MSKGISIKIDGKWAVVKEDAQISIEMSSPVLNEEGTFSLPFELPYEPNRHLFGSIGEPDGGAHLYDIDGKDFELYFDDVLMFYGVVETDDEEEITDTIPLNFVSGNTLLKDMIEGMKANKVEVKDKIKLGYVVGSGQIMGPDGALRYAPLDEEVFMNYQNANVSYAYPAYPYCNVRICYQPEGSDTYKVLEAKRPWSGVCFYVLYFLDCLWHKLSLSVKENQLLSVEDLKRLAFFTTKCKVTKEYTDKVITDVNEIMGFVPSFSTYVAAKPRFESIYDVFATGENFPEVDVSTIIESLKNAFGLKIVIDSYKNVSMILLKNVFQDTEVLNISCDIIAEKPKHYKKKGVIVKYGTGEDDDTAYNYKDWSNVAEFTDYGTVIEKVEKYDMNLYVNTISGKCFRVKVDKDTTEYPALFEVAQFNSVKIGEAPDNDCEEIEIGFSPIIMNDVNYKDERDKNIKEQILAAFIDASMQEPKRERITGWGKNTEWIKEENYDPNNNSESPLRTYDSGFTLGIMRGPGNSAGIDYYEENYDGNGNDAWTLVPTNYSFDEDYITNWNQVYDYNGTEAGVPYTDEMFSLKLRAQKDDFPIDGRYANRGLVDKFLTEYIYFLANHKTIIITARMEISQLINLKWEKKYRIGQRMGYINHINYTLSNEGISDVTIELFTI